MPDSQDDLSHLPTGPLTESELREFRAMLDRERKISWAWAFMKRTLWYVATFVAALVAFRNDIADMVKWFRS